MKKLILLSLIAFATCFVSCDKAKAQGYPSYTVSFPFGPATVNSATFAKPLALTVNNNVTYVTVAATDTLKLNATFGSNLGVGALVYVQFTASGAARVVQYQTGFTGNAISASSGKTYLQQFVYDGSILRPVAAALQLN